MLTEIEQKRIRKEFRVPVDSSYPGIYWIASLDYESFMPTDIELRQIRSFIEFIVRRTYREHWQKRILEEEEQLLACVGHNTTVFRKGLFDDADQGWRFRKATWDRGPMYIPSIERTEYRPHTLVEVMDIYEKYSHDLWDEWKLAHPEIFPPEQTSPATE